MNKINISTIAFLNFCLLLPVLHLQSYISGSGLIPILRGRGYLVLLLTFAMIFIFTMKKYKNLVFRDAFLFLLLVCFSLITIFVERDLQDYLGRSALKFNLGIVFFYVVYFFTGFFFHGLEKRKITVCFLWFLMIINLFCNYDFQSLRISLLNFDEDLKGIYLFLGDSFAIWSLLVLSFLQKQPFLSVIVVLLSAVCLFSFISRTSMYAFILVIPLIIFLTRKSLKYLAIIMLLFFIIFPSDIFDFIQKSSSRMFAFRNIEEDTSIIVRNYLFREGVSGIKQNWFFGDYSGQLRYSHLGSYMHNYLSLWRQFGIIPFACFCILLVFSTLKAWKILWKSKKNNVIAPEIFFLIVGGAFCLIEIIAARSYVSPYIWFFIGMSANLREPQIEPSPAGRAPLCLP